MFDSPVSLYVKKSFNWVIFQSEASTVLEILPKFLDVKIEGEVGLSIFFSPESVDLKFIFFPDLILFLN